jgi:hypothetical protein
MAIFIVLFLTRTMAIHIPALRPQPLKVMFHNMFAGQRHYPLSGQCEPGIWIYTDTHFPIGLALNEANALLL